jgi:DNA-binding NarL/FixJ family response regulator
MTQADVTVVLADDHAVVREGIAALCASNGLSVVGECSDGEAAVELVNGLKPDFAIIDMRMSGMTGIDVIQKLRKAGSTTKLLMFSMSRQESEVAAAIGAGADAYVLKDGPFRHVMEAISFVREGGVYISPFLRGAGFFTGTQREKLKDPLAVLSQREREVFSYLITGMRPKEIADLREISPKTVDTHRASLMNKLNVHHDIVALVKFAIEHGINIGKPPTEDG